MAVKLKFLGASGTVTGSKYLVTGGNKKILVDVGLFQGSREWVEHNWDDPPGDLHDIDAVFLTHAHIDHTGILPRWVAKGIQCPIFCSAPTFDLSQLLLLDSGHLQEEEAEYRARSGRSRYNPPLPLYTVDDAKRALELFHPIEMGKATKVLDGAMEVTWTPSGHILGAGSISLKCEDREITFSGDIGRYIDPISVSPMPLKIGNTLLIESTYGDRDHPDTPTEELLKIVIQRTFDRGGVLVIPSFAVGRTQQLLYYIGRLQRSNQIRKTPVIVDSPMARDATYIYMKYQSLLSEGVKDTVRHGLEPFHPLQMSFTQSRDDSIALNSKLDPMIIISASGMLTGGRILHHLRHRLADPKNTLLFVGFQPPGGKGDTLLRGATEIRIFKDSIPVRAEIAQISGLSAHADREELLKWCKNNSGTPENVYVVHGEPESARSFAQALQDKFKWKTNVARYLQEIEI